MASYSDNFNRATLGSGWATLNGGAWGIDASTYLTQEQTTGTYRVLRYESTFDSDDIDVTMEVYSPGTNTGAGIIARLPNTGTATADIDGYGLVFFPGDTFYLLRFDSGDDSGVGYGYTWGSPSTSTYYTLRLTVQGSTVTGYVDGTQRFQFTDATYSGSGNRRVGAISYGSVSNTNGARYDNFVALDIVSSQTITPNLLSNTNTFPTALVENASGTQGIAPALLTNTNTLYSPTLIQEQTIQPNVVRRTNRSIKFNGNGADVNRIRIPLEDGVSTQYPINVGASHFTTEAWIRANYSENTTTATGSDARYSNIIYDRDSWGEQRGHVWGVTRSGSNLVACFGQAGSGGSWNTIFTTSNIGDGEWHHIAVTRNQTTGVVKIWIDGVEEASGTYDTTNWSFPAGHTVGSGQDNEYLVLGTEKHDVGYYYTGELDEFRVSNEVKYTSTFTPSRQLPVDDGVVGLYRCDEGSGTVFFDETLNTNGELLVGGSPSGPTWISLEDSYNLFFAPTVEVGGIALLPNLLENTSSIHSPTITTGAVSVSPNLLTNTNTFYNPTISVGSVSVEPNLLENINTISEPTISVGAVTVSPNVLVNTSVVQEPTINVGAVAVSPNVLTNTNVFYSPTVSSGYAISPDLLENTSVVHEPTINPGSVSVNTNTLENTTIFYSPTVSSGYTISVDLLENTNTVHQPTINVGAVTIATNTLTSTTVFYSPIVNAGGTIIQPDVLENSSVVHEPIISVGSVNVQPELLESTNTLYSPTINPGSVALEVDALNNNNVIYEPVVSSGEITVVPNTLSNSNTIYDIIVSAGAVNVSPALLENTNTFYGPTVVQNVTTDLLENTNVIHEPSVVQVISTQLLNNTNSFYSPTITTGAVNIETVRVESTTVIYEPQVYIGGDTTITMNLLTNTSVFYSPTLVDRYGRINRVSATGRTNELSSTTREYDILVN